eukprot:352525-Prymnesium_polylepis.1
MSSRRWVPALTSRNQAADTASNEHRPRQGHCRPRGWRWTAAAGTSGSECEWCRAWRAEARPSVVHQVGRCSRSARAPPLRARYPFSCSPGRRR